MKIAGEKSAELRKERGMTQENLAGTIGVSSQAVSKWENSITMPDIALLPVIADIFGVSIDTLFSVGKEEKAKKAQFPCEKTPAAAFSYKLTYVQEVEDGSGEKLRVYGLLTGYRVMLMVYPLLSLAKKLAAATDDWYCFRG